MEETRLIEKLLGFLDQLPDGFAKGPREQLAVRELIFQLMEAGSMPADILKLTTLVGPLICGSPEQQDEFQARFKAHFGEEPRPRKPRPPSEMPGVWSTVMEVSVLAVPFLVFGIMYTIGFLEPLGSPDRPPVAGYPPQGLVTASAPVLRSDTLTGIVQTAAGLPLSNATVRTHADAAAPESREVTTDADGRFTIRLAKSVVARTLAPVASIKPVVRSSYTSPTVSSLQVQRFGGIANPPASSGLAYSPDGNLLASIEGGYSVAVLTPRGTSFDLLAGHDMLRSGPEIRNPTFSQDGNLLAAIQGNTFSVWDTSSGKTIPFDHSQDHQAAINRIAFSPDSRLVATASSDKTVKVWRISSGKALTLKGHTGAVNDISFGSKGNLLASGGEDGWRIWDVRTGREEESVEPSEPVTVIAFARSEDMLAAGGLDGTLRLWRLSGEVVAAGGLDDATRARLRFLSSSNQLLAPPNKGTNDAIVSLAFSPDGSLLASGSANKTIELWRVALGERAANLQQPGPVDSVAFDSTGTLLGAYSLGTSTVWDLTSAMQIKFALLATHPDYEPGYVDQPPPSVSNVVTVGPLKAAARVLKLTASATFQPPRRFSRRVSAALASLPLIAVLLVIRHKKKIERQRKAILKQWETPLDLRPLRVHTKSAEDHLFQSAHISPLARDLLRRLPQPSSELAIETTVRITAARAGLVTPVLRERRAAREFLVLVERKSEKDQQASLWNCLLNRLAARDIHIERYYFSGDPRVCEASGSERAWVRLDEYSALHPHYELLLVASPDRFFDPVTRRPAPWLARLSQWPRRSVLCLSEGAPGDLESLDEFGFATSPASLEGLAALNQSSQFKGAGPDDTLYPAELANDESRWVQSSVAATDRELTTLHRHLRAWLGRDGYRCLLACSVYPGMAWNLTLHLALGLIPEDSRDQTLTRLVRLPWFRYCRMPRWLRADFTARLDRAERERAMILLRDFIQNKAFPESRNDRETDGLEFVRRDIAEEMRVQGQNPTQDYVFLSFLSGRQPEARDLEAPGFLRRILYPEGLPLHGLRPRVLFTLGALSALSLFIGAELLAQPAEITRPPEWRESLLPESNPRNPPTSMLAGRALEIGAAELNQRADDNTVVKIFEQAAPFAGVQRSERRKSTAGLGTLFVPSSGGSPALVERFVSGGLILLEPWAAASAGRAQRQTGRNGWQLFTK